MASPRIGRAPDYTRAALAMGLVNLLWIFGLVWALLGLPAVLLLALLLNRLIDRLARPGGPAARPPKGGASRSPQGSEERAGGAATRGKSAGRKARSDGPD